jgi:alpha-galactosidase
VLFFHRLCGELKGFVMAKIAIVGAGGYVFPLRMVFDILGFESLRDTHFSLMDIDLSRAERTGKGAQALIDEFSLPAKVDVTDSLEQAFDGTDFVICTFQVGCLDAFKFDVEIPREYGVDQTVGDTLGPGGIFRGLRSIGALMEIAKVYREKCPGALFLQYANPMAINSWAASELGINNVGLCHSVQGTSEMLAREIEVPIEECTYISAGINHQAWFVRFEHNGTDVIPRIREVMKEKHLAKQSEGERSDELHGGGPERVRTEIMELSGYFQTESSHHASEYMAYFRKTPELVESYLPTRWDYYEICSAHKEDQRNDEFLALAQEKGLKPSHEYGAFIINSVVTDTSRVIHGSVPNKGHITNLPLGCSVEIPCVVDGNGLRPVYVGALPPRCAAINRGSDRRT